MRTDLAAPYDWVNNLPDPNSQDSKNVIAWLIQQGAPRPQPSYLRLVFALFTPSVPAGFWVLQFPGMPYPCDLALSLNSPTLVLQELNDQLRLNLSIPAQYTPPTPPQPPPPAPSPVQQPANPVGPPMIHGCTGLGSDYFLAAGDGLAVGTLFPSPAVPGQPLYQKVGRETPWGTEIFWQRIA